MLSDVLDQPCLDPSCATDPSTHNGVPGPPNKWELGKAAWLYLHAYAGSPIEVNGGDHRTAWLKTFADLFPCSECRPHFVDTLKNRPPPPPPRTCASAATTAAPQAEGHSSAAAGGGGRQDVDMALWMCEFHNDVNRRLDKPVYPCIADELLKHQL